MQAPGAVVVGKTAEVEVGGTEDDGVIEMLLVTKEELLTTRDELPLRLMMVDDE